MSTPTELAREPRFWGTVVLVARREVLTRMRSKAFLAMSGVLVLVGLGATLLPNLLGGPPDPVPVVVVGNPPATVADSQDLDGVPYFDIVEQGVSRDEAEQAVRAGEVDAALVFDGDRVQVVGLQDPPTRVIAALSVAPEVTLLDPLGQDPQTLYFVSLAFGITFFMSAVTFGNQIAQSVVEEKQSRIVEILLSAISPRALLTGKVLGNTVLALGQVLAIAGAAIVGLLVTGEAIGLGDLGAPIAWFVAYFLVGFVMVEALFAAAASLISRAEDVGSVTAPVMMLVMVPYVLSVSVGSDEVLNRVMAWVPFSAPSAMPAYLFSGNAQWWEPIGALGLLMLTAVALIAVGERIYRNSLLRTGARLRWRDAITSRA